MLQLQQLNHWMGESEQESKHMNTYYTAKDIEELAGNGTKQLVIGPGVFLTDYARETAQQLGIALVRSEDQAAVKKTEAYQPKTTSSGDQYNKPRGCQHGSNSRPADFSQAANPSVQSNKSRSSNGSQNASTVNKLVDLMGKVIKRGR